MTNKINWPDHVQEFDYATAYKRSNDLVRHVPPGQPIQPPGHHSHQRHVNTLKKSHAAMDKSVREADKSKHWGERSADVLSHVARKFQPGAILRRIKKLEAAKRKSVKERELSHDSLDRCAREWMDEYYSRADDADYLALRVRVGDLIAADRATFYAYLDSIKARNAAYQDRWTAHYDGQIKF